MFCSVMSLGAQAIESMPSKSIYSAPEKNASYNSVEDILVPFFNELSHRKISYCVLHSYDTLPETVGSDLDIAMKIDKIADVESLLSDVATDNDWEIIQRLWYDIPLCFYYVLKSKKRPFRSVAIDILVDPDGIGRYGFSAETLIHGRVNHSLFYHSDPSVEFCYKLTKRVRKGVFKDEDKEILNLLFSQGDPKLIKDILTDHYGKNMAERLIAIFQSDSGFQGYLEKISTLSITQLLRKRYRSPAIVFKRAHWQTRRILHRITRPAGLVVTLPNRHYHIMGAHQDAFAEEVRPAFRKVIFKSKWRLLDVALALSTSTLLVVPDSNEVGFNRIIHGLDKASVTRKPIDNSPTYTEINLSLVSQILERLRKRMDERLLVK